MKDKNQIDQSRIQKFKVFDNEKKEFVNPGSKFLLACNGCLIKYGVSGLELAPENFITIHSTGLKDMNGKEYEDGTIAKTYKGIGVVSYENGAWKISSEYNDVFHNCYDEFEIIGSKYTNPELLEK